MELIALTNEDANGRFSNTHKNLTIVHKPELHDEPAVYHPNNAEKAFEDKEIMEERHNHNGFEIVKLEKTIIKSKSELE